MKKNPKNKQIFSGFSSHYKHFTWTIYLTAKIIYAILFDIESCDCRVKTVGYAPYYYKGVTVWNILQPQMLTPIVRKDSTSFSIKDDVGCPPQLQTFSTC